MKATGIVRRIDDLGRVVIPKEIRRTLRLREGTPLEIFTDREGEIILKKYSPMAELSTFARQYAESLAQSTGLAVCVTDRDQVIAVAGGLKKELLQKSISKPLEQMILDSDMGQRGNGSPVEGMYRFIRLLMDKFGLSEEDINLIAKTNPAKLLGV